MALYAPIRFLAIAIASSTLENVAAYLMSRQIQLSSGQQQSVALYFNVKLKIPLYQQAQLSMILINRLFQMSALKVKLPGLSSPF